MSIPTVRAETADVNPVNTGAGSSRKDDGRGVRLSYSLLLGLAFSGLLLLIGISDTLVMYKSKQLYAELFEMNQSYRRIGRSLEQVRSDIQISNVLIRDFLLDPSFLRAESYRSELLALRRETDKYLGELKNAPRLVRPAQLIALKEEVNVYWDSLNPVFEWTPSEKRASSYIFLRRQVMPRRDAVLTLATEIEQFSEESLAKEQRDIAASEKEFKRFEKRMLAGSVLLGLAVALLCLLRVRTLEKREHNQYQNASTAKRRAQQAEQDLRQLSRQLVRTQEEERRSISRELHDEVGQMLTGLRMELRAIQRLHSSPKDVFDARLEESKHLIERTLRSVRDLAMGLRPSMLDDLGLRPALEWQAREFERRYEIPVRLTMDESMDGLPENHRTTVFRIVQEALTNCARHAHAKNIEVSLINRQGVVELIIADDGIGFTRSSQTGVGLGLIGIQERVRQLGGLFEVKPGLGGGTLLLAEIPFDEMVTGNA